MTLSRRTHLAVFALIITQCSLAGIAQAQKFRSQTTYDPDAAARRGAGSAFGVPGRSSGGGGIRTTSRSGSRPRPSTRPAPRTRPVQPRPVSVRPTIKPQTRVAPVVRPQPIKIGLYHSTGEFAPNVVNDYRRAKRDETVFAGHLRRIRRDFELAKKRGNQQAMQTLRNHYRHAKQRYDHARGYRQQAERFLNQKFAIHFTDTTMNKRHAFYAQLRQQVARYPQLNGKPFSIFHQNGTVKVIWFPGGRVNYGGQDLSHLFRL